MFNQAVRSRDNGRSLKRKVNAACKTLKAKEPVKDTDGVWIVKFEFPSILSMKK